MTNSNAEIERLIWNYRLKKWKIAAEVGVADATLSRWLRKKLSPERHEQVLAAIDKLSKEAEFDD